ncbi:MAG TPA: phosphatidate cytidylyltransferase [Spirochaetia bacterium]|nr:phosphatidate cytidylyltransferase [Spirochaetia bacterium]
MTKLAVRTISVVIIVPLLFTVILLAPWYHYLAFNIVCMVISIVGAYETANFFAQRGMPTDALFTPVLGGLLPLAAFLEVSGAAPAGLVLGVLVFAVAGLLVREVWHSDTAEFARILPRVAASITVLLYPGLFVTYVVRITGLPDGGLTLVVFLLIVFANDVFAYLVGMFLGASSRGVVPISPNKSIAGFAGGMTASILMAVGCGLLFPGVFDGSMLLAVGEGLGIGAFTILGDLVESALKRSSALKDSGTIVPGRGGILDSIDSVLFASPLCYYLFALAAAAQR